MQWIEDEEVKNLMQDLLDKMDNRVEDEKENFSEELMADLEYGKNLLKIEQKIKITACYTFFHQLGVLEGFKYWRGKLLNSEILVQRKGFFTTTIQKY